MNSIDDIAFEFTPDSVLFRNVDRGDGYMTFDEDAFDRLAATLDTFKQMIAGATVDNVGPDVDSAPNGGLKFLLSNGKQICLTGDWRIKVCQRT